MKKLFFTLSILFYTLTIFAQKNYLVIEYLSLQQQEIELKKVTTIEFTSKYIYFLDRYGEEIASKYLDRVRKISFTEDSFTNTEYTESIDMIVYPNPTMDALFIEGLKIGDIVRIYSMDGTLIKKEIVEDDVLQISVGDIETGSYLLQSNTKVVKFIKK